MTTIFSLYGTFELLFELSSRCFNMFPLPDPVLNVLKSQPIGAAVLWTIRPPNSGFRFALAGAIQKFIFTAAWSKCGAISVKLLSVLWA